MVDVVIVGSVALDTVETPFGKAQNVLGGAATYASYAASFFAKPGIVAVIGKDFPEKYIEEMKKRNINLKGLKRAGKTFRWHGKYEYDMNNRKTIKVELNSFQNFKPEIPEEYRNCNHIFLANINPELQLAVLEQIRKPELVVLDTMDLWINGKKEKLIEAIKKTDILLLNDSEARQLFETPNLVLAANKALSLGVKHVIIKKGEHGSLMFNPKSHFSAPGYPLEVVKDPTGSGDSFAGAMIGYLAKTRDLSEKSLRKAIIYGSVIASYNAEDFSVNRLGSITKEDIKKRYSEFQSMRKF